METLSESRLNLVEFKARAYMSQEQKGAFRMLRRLVGLGPRGKKKRRWGRRARAAHYGRRLGGGGRGPGRPYTGGRKPRSDVPYERHSRDADGDGLLQEGTIWERPVGSGVHTQEGPELEAGAMGPDSGFTTIRNAAGEATEYDPKKNPKSPQYQRTREVRDGQRRVARGRAQVEQAARDRTVKPREREIGESEAAHRRRLSIILEEDNINRMLDAEERVGASRSDRGVYWRKHAVR